MLAQSPTWLVGAHYPWCSRQWLPSELPMPHTSQHGYRHRLHTHPPAAAAAFCCRPSTWMDDMREPKCTRCCWGRPATGASSVSWLASARSTRTDCSGNER